LDDTGLARSALRAVGLKDGWMHQICSYPFVLSDLLGSLDFDPTDRINGGEKLTEVLGFQLSPAR
jgi:hypothetical protein